MNVATLNGWSEEQATAELARCCSSQNWVKAMVTQRPFAAVKDLLVTGESTWKGLTESDWLEAFSGHPKIGDMDSLRAKFGGDHQMSEREQSGVNAASEDVLLELARLNQVYEDRHGFIFIVCATGKSAAEMLDLLRARVDRGRSQELETAAAEQWKITKLRLEALL